MVEHFLNFNLMLKKHFFSCSYCAVREESFSPGGLVYLEILSAVGGNRELFE